MMQYVTRLDADCVAHVALRKAKESRLKLEHDANPTPPPAPAPAAAAMAALPKPGQQISLDALFAAVASSTPSSSVSSQPVVATQNGTALLDLMFASVATQTAPRPAQVRIDLRAIVGTAQKVCTANVGHNRSRGDA
jgi:hypothetical protein